MFTLAMATQKKAGIKERQNCIQNEVYRENFEIKDQMLFDLCSEQYTVNNIRKTKINKINTKIQKAPL